MMTVLFLLGLFTGITIGWVAMCFVMKPAAASDIEREQVPQIAEDGRLNKQLENMFRYNGTGRGQKSIE